ncbi:E3 ubiquitin-protein ligase TM129-like [Littorina saxatilis]|uniref:E3 ubiquitin-protein ligase TM129 n=1 Tax=Littorina saxatilis TaxID=31220 RepID=A0AAN9GID9_9CAEN
MDPGVSMYLFYSLMYGFFCLCFIAPPTEFVSAGLTIQNMFSSFLGSEEMTFVEYHIRKTTATAFIHSLLPLGYYLGLGLFAPELSLFALWELNMALQLLLSLCILPPLSLGLMVLYWHQDTWDRHPIATQLAELSNGGSWRAVASSINTEFRRIDKFASGAHGRRLYVTDSWILKTTTYYLYVAHQNDINLVLEEAEEHPLSYENPTAAQFLNISIRRVEPHLKDFQIRLNALEYSDLRGKLQAQVQNARHIVVRQSLSDQFLEAFSSTVSENPGFRPSPHLELEQCIGCMQKESDVKLQKNCREGNPPEAGEPAGGPPCVQCFCRPMWCLECMGKWFASRQDQQRPETWLSGKAPCPTCRSVFCMLDVVKILKEQ